MVKAGCLMLQVMPEVFKHLEHGADPVRRIMLLERLTELVRQLRQHMRKWLTFLVELSEMFWDPSCLRLTEALLALHSELASMKPIPSPDFSVLFLSSPFFSSFGLETHNLLSTVSFSLSLSFLCSLCLSFFFFEI